MGTNLQKFYLVVVHLHLKGCSSWEENTCMCTAVASREEEAGHAYLVKLLQVVIMVDSFWKSVYL